MEPLPAEFLDQTGRVLGDLPGNVHSVYPLQDEVVCLHRVRPGERWAAGRGIGRSVNK